MDGDLFSEFKSSRPQGLALDHLSEQLEKLYGPLAFLIIEGQRSYRDLLEILGRQQVFENAKQYFLMMSFQYGFSGSKTHFFLVTKP